MPDAIIADIRAFNRFYTRVIGVLDAELVSSPFTLSEARVLYELATRGRAVATELVRYLGVDPAYLSRLLAKFSERGLLRHSPNPADRRQNFVSLTARGEAAFTELNAASDRAVAELIKPLEPSRRAALVAAMATIRSALDDPMPAAPLLLRPPRMGEVAHVVGRQTILYARDYGWDGSYEGLAAEIAGRFLQNFKPGREACWIAERQGEIVGSVFLVDAGEGAAQLRLLFVEPQARGLGIGKLLVRECVHFSRSAGYKRMRLWTQSILVHARVIYTEAGFRLIREEPHHSFGHDLVGETWELEL